MASSQTGKSPPFKVPAGLAPISNAQLEGTELLEFFRLNEEDFFAVIAIRYVEVFSDPDPGALQDPEKGFEGFCDLMTGYFLAPPSSGLASRPDEHGLAVNFFGAAIMKHLGGVTAQQLYAHDGTDKYHYIWRVVNVFVQYVVIRCFKRGLSWFGEADILKERERIKQLREGKRTFREVPKAALKIYH